MTHDIDEDMIDLLNEAFVGVSYHREWSDLVGDRDARRSRRRKSWTAVAGFAVAAAAATGGIAAAGHRGLPAGLSYAANVRSTAQAAALKDGEVSFDEYKAAFERFSTCMTADSRPLASVTLNPVTELYSYVYDGVDDCYDREFYAVDFSWQVSDERPRDPLHPDISSRQIRAACAANDPSALVGVPEESFTLLCQYVSASTPTTNQP